MRAGILFLVVFILSGGKNESETYFITIGEETSLTINGSTSINKFQCGSTHVPLEDTLQVRFQRDSSTFLVEEGKMIFRIREIECGDPYSNRQLSSTLNGRRYPFILVALNGISPNQEDWKKSKAFITLELAGVERKREVSLEIMSVYQGKFHFTGRESLLMSSFGLVPPKPMLGLVKVNDTLNVDFDLWLQLVEE